MFYNKINKEGEAMKRVVVFVMALVLSGLVSVSDARDPEKLMKNRDALVKRLSVLTNELTERLNKVDKIDSCNAKLSELRRITLLQSEIVFLSSAVKELDKMVFGLDIGAAFMMSGVKLSESITSALADLYRPVMKKAEDSLMIVIECSFCTPESRYVAKQALQDLRADWRY
jgi:predicted nuclease with TOPRIM domain